MQLLLAPIENSKPEKLEYASVGSGWSTDVVRWLFNRVGPCCAVRWRTFGDDK